VPPTADKRATLSVKISARTLEAIDAARGDMTRSGWLRQVISLRLAHITGAEAARSGGIPVVVLKQGTPETTADRPETGQTSL
jgi:hypothetical protein